MGPYFDLPSVGVPCFKENQNAYFESEDKLNAGLFYVTKNLGCPLCIWIITSLTLLNIFYVFNVCK